MHCNIYCFISLVMLDMISVLPNTIGGHIESSCAFLSPGWSNCRFSPVVSDSIGFSIPQLAGSDVTKHATIAIVADHSTTTTSSFMYRRRPTSSVSSGKLPSTAAISSRLFTTSFICGHCRSQLSARAHLECKLVAYSRCSRT